MPVIFQPDSKPDNKTEKTDTIEMAVLSDPKGTEHGRENRTVLVAAPEETPLRTYMTGWRLYILVFGLCLSLLLSTLETTIVSTSLVSITNALSGFEDRDWVVTSYLLTYTGTRFFFISTRATRWA